MRPEILKIYQRLPYNMRSAAASLWGHHLRSWRYGTETEKLVEEALARESWSHDQWQKWQQSRLLEVLRQAVTYVPHYRDYWMKRKNRGDNESWEKLENWPVLSKEEVRKTPKAFVADTAWKFPLYKESTSGSTGTPLTLWASRKTIRNWYALFEARWRRWYGVSLDDRWGILGGQLVVSADSKTPPFWVWNHALYQLYLSAYHLSPKSVPSYVEAIRQYKLQYLLGYTSSLDTLAAIILEEGLKPPALKVVITNAEPVYEYQRRRIENAFQCPVRETYGMSEKVAGASECGHGTLHLWPEAGLIEVLEGNQPALSGQTGDFVCTGLINPDMPLIRYKLGDRGAVSRKNCKCGVTLPVLSFVEGRSEDVLVTPEGRFVGRMDPVFKGNFPIQEAQIIQESVDEVRVLVVPAKNFTQSVSDEIAVRVRERMGKVSVKVEKVEGIPRSANGKFRAVISRISASNLPSSGAV